MFTDLANSFRHFNFLISKYPKFFSLRAFKKLRKIYEINQSNLISQNQVRAPMLAECVENQDESIRYSCEKINKQENENCILKDDISYYESNSEINEIYNCLKKQSKTCKIIEIYMKLLDIVEYIPDIKFLDLLNIFSLFNNLAEKINLKFRLENKKDKVYYEINELNSQLFFLFKFYLFNDMSIFKESKDLNNELSYKVKNADNKQKAFELNSSSLFTNSGNIDYKSAFLEFILNRNLQILKSIKISFYEKCFDALNEPILFFRILSPKNNSIFKHTNKSENIPFFLEISLKINNIDFSDTTFLELIKNLEVVIIELNEEIETRKKSFSLSFSNTQLKKNEFEKYYKINHK